MKILTLPFKIIIGIILFVVLICAYYCVGFFYSSSSSNVKVGTIEYRGEFLMPIENFKVVTSKYGMRIHPKTRKSGIPFRN